MAARPNGKDYSTCGFVLAFQLALSFHDGAMDARAKRLGMRRLVLGVGCCLAFPLSPSVATAPAKAVFRVGACAIDVNPPKLPVHVLGMFTDRTADKVCDPLYARCLVLDDGQERLAIVVVDSCMMPRDLLDHAKDLASQKTGIRTERLLISATHTHSAPAAMGGLGTPPDEEYAKYLPGRIAEGIARAAQNLAPARVGWALAQAPEYTHTRRWIFRADKMTMDPFAERTVRANMHPGYMNPNVIGPSGPSDPEIAVVAFASPEGRPLALLANYSMHYYESPMLSADYYGKFAERIGQWLGADTNAPAFVAMMSQGTSGDQMWMDYGRPANPPGLEAYSSAIASKVFAACKSIRYRDWAPLAMREAKLTLNFRLCDDQRLAWAKQLVAQMNGRLPRTQPEVYAYEQVYLRQRPTAELKLQALRIGDVAIATFPNEVFALTGLKIKAQSPLQPTFNVTLANGSEGYIPPPEQHRLGGYTTWAARTAGLEVEAEPKIVETLLQLLENVSDKPRRKLSPPRGPYGQAVLASKPLHYWRLNEFNGPWAADAKGAAKAEFCGGVAFYLPGPPLADYQRTGKVNRAPHFAGGSLRAITWPITNTYSAELWFWNGLPVGARGITACLFSRYGPRGQEGLAIGGTNGAMGKLLFTCGTNATQPALAGRTPIQPKTWNHVVLVRQGRTVRVHLNGQAAPEIAGEAACFADSKCSFLSFGDAPENAAPLEGRLDEIAFYLRALKPAETAAHFRASGLPPQPQETP
jgi:hypothetical protein